MKEKIRSVPLYGGIFLLSLSLLLFELLLTRIFSVTVFYHFAFFTVSLALLGLGAGGIFVYLFSKWFQAEQVYAQASKAALLFALTATLSAAVNMSVPLGKPELNPKFLLSLTALACLVAAAFFCGGLAISLLLTHFPKKVSVLYCYDLVGAGLACALLVPLLERLGAPSAVLLVSVIACLAALLLAQEQKAKRLVLKSALLTITFAVLFGLNPNLHLLTLRFPKGQAEEGILYEKRNALSRLTVFETDGILLWGKGKLTTARGKQLLIDIDRCAVTPIIAAKDGRRVMEWVKNDIVHAGYHVAKPGKALIIGAGGGRDVHVALSYGFQEVHAVEINHDIVDIVERRFRDFSGGVYSLPKVRKIVADGRSYVARSKDKFDFIQISFIDTYAAAAQTAFMLSENTLYTVEAFIDYLNHLTDDGIVSVSRWMGHEPPSQGLRVVSVAVEALSRLGINNPKLHLAAIAADFKTPYGPPVTVLVKRTPFTPSQLEQLKKLAKQQDWRVVFMVGNSSNHRAFADLLNTSNRQAFYRTYPFNIIPSTDDNPFFFNCVRLRDAFALSGANPDFNVGAVSILVMVLVVVAYLTLLFIVFPLLVSYRRARMDVRGRSAFMLYFTALGLAYMLVEIPMISRLVLFLGHPTYALSVVLFSMLLFSGIGSLLTGAVTEAKSRSAASLALLGTLALLLTHIFAMPKLYQAWLGVSLPARIAIAVLSLLPLALLMGMPFPLGIKALGKGGRALIPWVWGVNGAASVLASVLALAIALEAGFSKALLTGVGAYGLALGMMVTARTLTPSPSPTGGGEWGEGLLSSR